MIWENIADGDLIVIDKSLEVREGDTVVCYIDGEFTMKMVHLEKDALILMPANPNYKPIRITEENQYIIWGIVTYTIRNHYR